MYLGGEMEMVEKMDGKWGWKRERNSEMYPDSKRFGGEVVYTQGLLAIEQKPGNLFQGG
jgi:hypothetical protein